MWINLWALPQLSVFYWFKHPLTLLFTMFLVTGPSVSQSANQCIIIYSSIYTAEQTRKRFLCQVVNRAGIFRITFWRILYTRGRLRRHGLPLAQKKKRFNLEQPWRFSLQTPRCRFQYIIKLPWINVSLSPSRGSICKSCPSLPNFVFIARWSLDGSHFALAVETFW